jgi:hypothetical protein
MDRRVDLIRNYYRSLPTDRVKVETRNHGFAYLERLLQGGATLEYGELTLTGLLHKYKLANVPPHRIADLVLARVAGDLNVCLYFGDRENSLFCFNLDNNHKTANTALIPEMEIAVEVLRGLLVGMGIRPLVLASGRGFHVWCRLAGPVDNDRIYEFMLRVSAKTAARIHAEGHDHATVKINLYPDRRTRDIVSLRLFGSVHSKNGTFSRVATPGAILDEAGSWEAFAEHLQNGAADVGAFLRSHAALTAAF